MAIIPISERKGNGFKNLIGKKYGNLTVIGLSDKMSGRKSYWYCKCDCGNEIEVRSDNLTTGNTLSCGCLKKAQDRINLTKFHRHKESRTKLHDTWVRIKQRCLNPNNKSYINYGGRGITVCKEWSESYENFRDWSLNNGYADNLSIDRIDVNGNYEPSNCRWANAKQQANNRRSNLKITYNSETKTLMQWAEVFNLPYSAVTQRYKRGVRGDELFAPLNTKYMPKVVYYNGESHNLAEWARIYNLNRRTVQERYNKGIQPPELFEKPKKETTPR